MKNSAIPFTLRFKEALETVAGLRGPRGRHAVRWEDLSPVKQNIVRVEESIKATRMLITGDFDQDIIDALDAARAQADAAATVAVAADTKAQLVRDDHDALVVAVQQDFFDVNQELADIAVELGSVAASSSGYQVITDEVAVGSTGAAVTTENGAATLGQLGSVLITEGAVARDTSGTANGFSLVIPTEWALQFAARRVKISVLARAPSVNPATRFSLSYSTADVGNSGALSSASDLTGNAQWFSFYYDVPAPVNGGADILTLFGDDSKTGKTTEIMRVMVEVASEAEELPEITELQGHITSLFALDADGLDGTVMGAMLNELNVAGNGTIAGVSNFGTAMANLLGQSSAVIVLRAKAGGNAGEVEVVAWDDATGGGSTITLTADNIFAEGFLSATKLAVGLGRNMLINTNLTDPDNDLLGVEISAGGASGPDHNLSKRTPPQSYTNGLDAVYQVQQNTPEPNGTTRLQWTVPADNLGNLTPPRVEAGQHYDFSANIALLRCDATLGIQWRDAANAVISEDTVATISPVAVDTTNPDLWPRIEIVAQAPANAVYGRPFVLKSSTTSSTGSFMFVSKPMMSRTHASAARARPYEPSTTTYIDGQKIITASLYAESINTASFQSAGLQVFGGFVQSTNFVSGSTGWQFDVSGSLEVNNLIVRGSIVEGAVSDGGSLSAYATPVLRNSGEVSVSHALGPQDRTQFWTFAVSVTVRAHTIQDLGSLRRVFFTRPRLQVRTKSIGAPDFGLWADEHVFVVPATANWQELIYTYRSFGNWDDIEYRLIFDTPNYETTAPLVAISAQDNVRDLFFYGKALVR